MRYEMQGSIMIGVVLPISLFLALAAAALTGHFSSPSGREVIHASEDCQVVEYLRHDTIIRSRQGFEEHKSVIPGLSEFRKIAVFQVRNGYKQEARTTIRYGWDLKPYLSLDYNSQTLTLTCASGNLNITPMEEKRSLPLWVGPILLGALLYLKRRKDDQDEND